MIVAALKYPDPAQEMLSGPYCVKQPVYTAIFVVSSTVTPREQTRQSVIELMNPATRPTKFMASTRESESAQEKLSDLSCVKKPQ